MAFGDPFGTPFNEATAVAALNDVFDIAIDGIPFRLDELDPAFEQGMQTIAAIREQADNSALPGEQSISREELWRAGQDSWHKGAGQRYRDKQESDQERFWASRGIDVWTKDELRLLHSTSLDTASANANPQLLRAGNLLYLLDGTAIHTSADADDDTWTSSAFPNSQAATSIATDGYRLWAVTPSNAYTAVVGGGWTAWIAQPASGSWDKVAYVNGRLVVTNNQFIAEVSGTATINVLNPDEGNAGWKWTAITDGTSAIYLAGYAGNRSQVYSLRPPTDDPSALLGVPIPAAPAMPTDEIVRSLYSYLGLLCLGTDKGIRVADKLTDYAGRELISVGQLIQMPGAVLCMDGEGSYVYFGWSNFATDTSGLGRLNLAQATDAGVYAYASDLMADVDGAVTSVASFGGRRYFTVANEGVYKETDTYVTDGYLDSGYIRFSLIDEKVAYHTEIRHSSVAGAIGVAIAADGSSFTELGTDNTPSLISPNMKFSAKQIHGYSLEVRTELFSADNTTPVVQHVELRAWPTPSRGETFLIPILLEEIDSEFPGATRHPSDDYEFLRQLARNKHTVTYQELSKTFNMTVLDFQFKRGNKTQDRRWWNGTLILKVMAPAD